NRGCKCHIDEDFLPGRSTFTTGENIEKHRRRSSMDAVHHGVSNSEAWVQESWGERQGTSQARNSGGGADFDVAGRVDPCGDLRSTEYGRAAGSCDVRVIGKHVIELDFDLLDICEWRSHREQTGKGCMIDRCGLGQNKIIGRLGLDGHT